MVKNFELSQGLETQPHFFTSDVYVDADATSLVATFSNKRGQYPVDVAVAPSVAGYPWLELTLQQQGGTTAPQLTLQPGARAQLVLRAKETQKPSVLEKLRDAPKAIQMDLQVFPQHGGQPDELTLEITQPNFVTSTLAPPEYREVYSQEVTINLGDLAREADVAVSTLMVAQPDSLIPYGNADPLGRIEAVVHRRRGAGQGESLLASLARSGSPGRPTQRPFEQITLAPQSRHELTCYVNARELQAPDVDGTISLDVTWRFVPLDAEHTPGVPQDVARHPVVIRRSLDQLLEVRINNGGVVKPSIVSRADAPVTHVKGDVRFNAGDDGAGELGATPFVVEAALLDASFQILRARVLLRLPDSPPEQEGAGAQVATAEIDLTAHPVAQPFELFSFNLDDAIRSSIYADHTGDLEIRIDLQVTGMQEVVQKLAQGALSVLAKPRKRRAGYVGCLDVGASATSFWFGRNRIEDEARAVPLGDFLFAVAGKHPEYDPRNKGRNALLPMSIGLSSDAHLRSQKDPLSLGLLSRVGASQDAVAARLHHLDRAYDISLPVPSWSAVADPKARGVVIGDLKRRLLTRREMTTAQVWRKYDTRVVRSEKVVLSALVSDVFDELAEYVVPRSLQIMDAAGDEYAMKDGVPDRQDAFQTWLDLTPEDLELVITHPTGIHPDRLTAFKEAGRRFARRLLNEPADSTRCEPKFVSEALAAAHYCIYRDFHSGRTKSFPDGVASFACLDIGASTFDAILVTAQFDHRGYAKEWTINAHFGGPLGGHNLDDALLLVALRTIKETVRARSTDKDGPVLETAAAQDDDHLAALMVERIRDAKIGFSNTVRERTRNRSYRWPDSEMSQFFEVPLRGVLEPRTGVPPKPQRGAGEFESNEVHIAYAHDLGYYVLKIPRWMLSADTAMSADHADLWHQPGAGHPATVARFLGVAVPAMMAQEARRVGLRDLNWVVTGRTSLWPPIYSAISDTIRAMNVGKMTYAHPFAPEEMKTAIVEGARAFAYTRLNVSEGAPAPLAIIRMGPMPRPNAQGVTVKALEYVKYLDQDEVPPGDETGTFQVPDRSDAFVCSILPGLNESGIGGPIDRTEIQGLFKLFGIRLFQNEEELAQNQSNPGEGMASDIVSVRWSKQKGGVLFVIDGREHFVSNNPIARS